MAQRAIIVAHQRGYKVLSAGKVLGVRGYFLNPCIDDGGYYVISVRIHKGMQARVKVHRLMAYQKFGDALFKPGIEVRHLNNNKLDNSWSNIAIGTQADNIKDGNKYTPRPPKPKDFRCTLIENK